MARYDLHERNFLTPRGNVARMLIREDTNDYNTVNSCLDSDEYGLRERWITGHALDIGSHLGSVAIAIALDNPGVHVTAVEPVPENCALIRQNLAANGIADRVELVEALAGKKGVGTIRYAFKGDETALHHAYVGNSTLTAPTTTHTAKRVRSVSLAELLDGHLASFMKIDCEGGEWAFLDAPPAVLRLVETIVGEWHPNPPDGGTKGPDDLRALLSATHEVTFSGPEAGPGGFLAERLP